MAVDDTSYGTYGERYYRTDSEQRDAVRYRQDKTRERLRGLGAEVLDVRTIMVEPEIQDYYIGGDPYAKQYLSRGREIETLFTLEIKGRHADSLIECVERVTEFERRAYHYESELRVSTALLTKLQTQMGAIGAFLKDNPSAKDKWDELVVLAKLSGVDLKLD
jgi:hypothetical protein